LYSKRKLQYEIGLIFGFGRMKGGKALETLDYGQVEKEVVDFIAGNNKLVLATCLENRVTARTVSIINQGMKIYFQTDREFLKYRQIKENPNVAFSIENIQIEGQAKIAGHPLENPFFIEKYKGRHQTSFENYSHLQDEVVIEVEPTFITIWKYTEQDHKPYRDYLDVKKRSAYRELYSKKS
jgi:general stress protein 26